MQLPFELQRAIEALTETFSTKNLRSAREKVSADYRQGQRSSFQNKEELLSYLVTRMPATYAANREVFQAIRERLPEFQVKSLLDLGAGPGTASWAALDTFVELERLYLIEREQNAIEIGKKLGLGHADWQCAALEDSWQTGSVDLAILSYVFAEMSQKNSLVLLERLFKEKISLIAIIEPGTPKGFEKILSFREFALQKGAQIIAPCPHHFQCPMQGNSWCHFSARVERSRLHRQLKEGSLGFEDEKYSYLVFANRSKNLPMIEGRVVRSPFKGSGFVKLPLCAQDGKLKEITVTRSDKENYRIARDIKWGDIWK